MNIGNISANLAGGGRLKQGASTGTTSKTAETTKAINEAASMAGASVAGAPKLTAAITSTKLGLMLQPEIIKKIDPAILTINPNIISAILDKSTTHLARGAIQQLNSVGATVRDEAINTVKNSKITAAGLMNYLERRVKVGEVLNEMSKDWDAQTLQDFVEAFPMDRSKLSVMDAIVSLAILNDPELEDELRVEHMGDTSQSALLENRRVVWQYPPPGTPLDPPYVVMVAVEHQDLGEGQKVVDEIIGQLTVYEGFKVPKGPVTFKPLTATLVPGLLRQP
jgi:hypothetical protein